ncbi:hypothetical protein B7P43_G01511, partial [Cryptotermes secundus]
NTTKVHQIVRANRLLTVRSMAEQENTDRETVTKVLNEDLDIRKVCAKMVPFQKINEILKGVFFYDTDDISSNTTVALKTIPQNQFQNCFKGWTRGEYLQRIHGAVLRNMEIDSLYSDASTSSEEDEVDEGRCTAGETEPINWERDALELEAAGLRDQRKAAWALEEHVNKVTDERNVPILGAKFKPAVTENINKGRDALKLETEKHRTRCKER